MKIAMLQLNFKVGDFAANTDKIRRGYDRAVHMGADLVISTEMAIFGYPPGDMLLRNDYIDVQQQHFESLCRHIGNAGLIVGCVSRTKSNAGLPLYNSAVLIRNGKTRHIQHKSLLPNYDVFDERRYFEPFDGTPDIVTYDGANIGILVCEDIWNDIETATRPKLYHENPVEAFRDQSPDVIITINASPFYLNKFATRLEIAKSVVADLKCPLVYVNQVGGNDELMFDGQSFAVNAEGRIIASAKAFEEDLVMCDLTERHPITPAIPNDVQQLHDALVLGTRDYVMKSVGSPRVFIALSGGIDSAVTAYIAARALGPENVHGFSMPSEFSSEGSITDARKLAENLGISFDIIPIREAYHAFETTLTPLLGWHIPGRKKHDVTEENIQARVRGTIMMAISNRNGGIVLSTGNKSEVSVGYCTLYGDMAGGFAVLSDVLKTNVYALARHVNREREIIPWDTINKPPSAELRPDQKDQDTLPDYDVLDQILAAYIEDGMSAAGIIGLGHDRDIVEWVIARVNMNEYKRRQMAPGLKVTQKAFGGGRRMPIAAKL